MQYEDPFALLEQRRLTREQERLALRKRLAELDGEANEDQIVLKGLTRLYSKDGTPAPTPRAASSQSPAESAKDLPFKDLILAVLRDGVPGGMTAAQIKDRALLKYRRHINPNTLTVSLVRASKPRGGQPPLVRCDGRTWHYLSNPEAPNITRAPELALNGGASHG